MISTDDCIALAASICTWLCFSTPHFGVLEATSFRRYLNFQPRHILFQRKFGLHALAAACRDFLLATAIVALQLLKRIGDFGRICPIDEHAAFAVFDQFANGGKIAADDRARRRPSLPSARREFRRDRRWRRSGRGARNSPRASAIRARDRCSPRRGSHTASSIFNSAGERLQFIGLRPVAGDRESPVLGDSASRSRRMARRSVSTPFFSTRRQTVKS